jgi:hypothetical protein
MGRSEAEIEDLAQAWLRYWTWFSTEGATQFSAWQEKARKVTDPWHKELAEAERAKDWTRFDALLGRNPALKLAQPEAHEDEWVTDEVQAVLLDAEEGWRLLLALVRLAPDDVLGQIGAGPLEDWMDDERAATYYDRFRAELDRDPRFREMARAAWSMPTAIAEAIAAAPRDGV